METFNVNLSNKFLSFFLGYIVYVGSTLVLLYLIQLFDKDVILNFAFLLVKSIGSITIVFPLVMGGALLVLYVMNKITINDKYFNSELF